jgi:hypothetical protein
MTLSAPLLPVAFPDSCLSFVDGWALHPLKRAVFARRTSKAEVQRSK